MKKFILLLFTVTCMSAFSGCGKIETVMKPEKMDVEIAVPDNNWEVIADDESSYIISEGANMISCSVTEISPNDPVKLPGTEEELLSSLGESVAAISEISDFSYEDWPEEKTQSLFYKQTINDGTSVSVIICKDTITDNTRTTASATLIDADESTIAEIQKTIDEL